MIDLYALTSPNVQKVMIALEEMRLAYQIKIVDVWKGDQFQPELCKLNPNRKIPVIVDHNGPGGRDYVVFESGAILMYLAEKTGMLWPSEVTARYEVVQWLMLQMASIGPVFGNFVHFSERAPSGNEYSLGRFRTEAYRLYDLLEFRLGQSPYLGGADFSIADIAVFPWIRIHERQGVSMSQLPNMNRWFSEISQRGAVRKTIETIAAMRTDKSTASEENKDRLYGRGRFSRGPTYNFQQS
jgi:GST-like protein